MFGVFNALIMLNISEQIFLCLLFILCFTKICKIATISLKVEVWKKAGIMRYFNKIHVFSVMAVIGVMPFVASATEIMATREYVVPIYQATRSGTTVTSTNEGDIMQVNSTGYLERVTPVNDISTQPSQANAVVPVTAGAVYDALEDKEDVSNKLDGTTSGQKISDVPAGSGAGDDQTMYPSAAAVKEYAIQKPATAAAGKVLTYNGDQDSRPIAQYIQVPMATGDPATSGTVSGTASIWLQ